MNQPDLGKKVAELRKAKGLTQEELVEKCNLNVRTLQRIESGEVTPRSYTLKAIFSALDFNVYDSLEITHNKFRKTGFMISNWLEQFYRSVLDLFNLKTNTMKKVTILSILSCGIIIGLFALCNESNAQKEILSEGNENALTKSEIKVTGIFQGWDEADEFVGRDVNCTIDGVVFKTSLISVNKRTGEFHTFVKGTLFINKVEITHMLDLGSVKYTAEKIDKSGDYIVLKGNAKLIHTKGQILEADEMTMDKNDGDENKLYLKGNVKMIQSKDESIEAEVIVIYGEK